MRKLGVYIHIPFCKSKCAYCNFASFCDRENDIDRYLMALYSEIRHTLTRNDIVDTLYIGGGTPSILDAHKIADIIDAVKVSTTFLPREVTIECNPDSTTRDKLIIYKNSGVTRISMGVQSINDDVLKIIGRVHTASDAIEKARLVKDVGLDLSVDMILGLPNSKEDDIREFVEVFSDIGADHISAYSLSVEEGTPLYKLAKSGRVTIPTDDNAIDEYNIAYDYLTKHGYHRYEVSNFAKEGHESQHNNKYWLMEEYLGLGVASHSYIDGYRYYNPSNIDEYISRITSMGIAYTIDEKLTHDDIIEEAIMLGLRLEKGIEIERLDNLVNGDFLDIYSEKITKVKDFIVINDGYLSIKPEYMNVMNSIIIEIIS